GRVVEIGEIRGAPGLPPPFQGRADDRLGAFRRHEKWQVAVGDLARDAQPARRDRGGVDFEARVAVDDAAQRLAEPARTRSRIGDLVMLALMLERRLSLQHLADDRDVFAGAPDRLAERHAVPALDNLRPRGPDAAMAGPELDRRRELHDSIPSPARAIRSTAASQSGNSRSNGSTSTCSTPTA